MITTGSSNEVVENTTRKYVVRGDTAYDANGSIQVSIAALGTSSVDTNSVAWTDGATTQYWVNQSTSAVEGGLQSSTVLSGTKDETSPTVDSVLVSGTADDKWTDGDTVKVTFSEVMDASLFVTTGGTFADGANTLVPDGTYSVTAVPDTTGYLNRTAAASSKGNIPGVFASGVWVIGGDTTANGAQAAAIVSLMLSTNGKEFTVKITTAGTLTGTVIAESYDSSAPSADILKDVNTNPLATTVVTATGTGF